MSIKIRILALSFSTLMTAALAFGAGASIGSPAPDFTIDDQYDHPVRLSAYRGKPVLLVAGDRVGSDYMNNWEHGANAATLASGVTVIEVAILNGVPGFMHAYVKHRFQAKDSKGRANTPVALDWEGLIVSNYGFHGDLTNVYLIDCQGVLRYISDGKGTPQQIEDLVQAVKDLSQTGNPVASESRR